MKQSVYGTQENGTFVASNLKQFGTKVDALAGKRDPGDVLLRVRGLLQKKVSKSGRLYTITQYSKGKASDIKKVPSSEFEKNYRWFI